MKTIISTKQAPSAVGPYSQAVEANGFLFISGQIPINPETGMIVEGGIAEQTEQVLLNISAILDEAGLGLNDVVKCTCLLQDMDNFKAMNEVYSQFFTSQQPARAAYGVVKLPLGAMIEIEAIAAQEQ
jgi:2-iminobutanoate/2-iminopropanoate deaminase